MTMTADKIVAERERENHRTPASGHVADINERGRASLRATTAANQGRADAPTDPLT